jgi:beta-glucanase (GH16 family)
MIPDFKIPAVTFPIRTLVFSLSCLLSSAFAPGAFAEEWIQLFNGKDVNDWTVKIRYRELGDNFANTFRVEDGLLKVSYDGYDEFKEQFGHIFYNVPYSHYRIRVEYRFVGEQCKGGPGWAFRNSGIMVHGEDPKTMTKDQDFPASIEVQLLGGNGKDERPNANLCTPGTNVEIDGKLITRHCTNSTSDTYHGDQWVTVEAEVRGDEVIRHIIDGKVVLEYQKPQLDDRDAHARELIKAAGGELMLKSGTISLQSESHPVHFRKVELLDLSKE